MSKNIPDALQEVQMDLDLLCEEKLQIMNKQGGCWTAEHEDYKRMAARLESTCDEIICLLNGSFVGEVGARIKIVLHGIKRTINDFKTDRYKPNDGDPRWEADGWYCSSYFRDVKHYCVDLAKLADEVEFANQLNPDVIKPVERPTPKELAAILRTTSKTLNRRLRGVISRERGDKNPYTDSQLQTMNGLDTWRGNEHQTLTIYLKEIGLMDDCGKLTKPLAKRR